MQYHRRHVYTLLAYIFVFIFGSLEYAYAGESIGKFDLLRDDNSGGYLYNPATLVQCNGDSLTVSTQIKGYKNYEVHYVKIESNGLVGSIDVGGQNNTWSYGFGGNINRYIGAGIGIQRSGWAENERKLSVILGLSTQINNISLSVGSLLPFGENIKETEAVINWQNKRVGLSAGYGSSDTGSNGWAGIRLSPVNGFSFSYTADLSDKYSLGSQTTSLKFGQQKYLILTRKDDGINERYFVGFGMSL